FLLASGVNPNLAPASFLPDNLPAVFSAVATSGIMFALQGFEQAVQFGAETAPSARRHLVWAMALSILAAVALYMGLQLAFNPDVSPKPIFSNLVVPLGMLARANQPGLSRLIVMAAVISPMGVGLLYMGGAARQMLATARSHDLPPLTYMPESRMPLV